MGPQARWDPRNLPTILTNDTLSRCGCLNLNITFKAVSQNKCHLFVNIQPKQSFYSTKKETLLKTRAMSVLHGWLVCIGESEKFSHPSYRVAWEEIPQDQSKSSRSWMSVWAQKKRIRYMLLSCSILSLYLYPKKRNFHRKWISSCILSSQHSMFLCASQDTWCLLNIYFCNGLESWILRADSYVLL